MIGIRSLSLSGRFYNEDNCTSSKEDNFWISKDKLDLDDSFSKQNENFSSVTTHCDSEFHFPSATTVITETPAPSQGESVTATSSTTPAADASGPKFEGRIERVKSILSDPNDDLHVFSKGRSKKTTQSNRSRRSVRESKDFGRTG